MESATGKSPLGHPQVNSDGVRVLPATFHLKLPISFATADAAVLFTVPDGQRALIEATFWEPTADFTGGSSSAIGLSSSNAKHNTKGDLLGGASGDVAAALQEADGVGTGTIGANLSSDAIVVLEAGDTIRFDRITSAFTAGTGFAHVVGRLIG